MRVCLEHNNARSSSPNGKLKWREIEIRWLSGHCVPLATTFCMKCFIVLFSPTGEGMTASLHALSSTLFIIIKMWEILVPHNGVEDVGLLACDTVVLIGSSKHREPLSWHSIIPHGLNPHPTKWYLSIWVTDDVMKYSFIPLACAECDDSLPFSRAPSIPLCHIPFPSIIFHQPVFHPPSLCLAIYFLVYLSASLFPNSYRVEAAYYNHG